MIKDEFVRKIKDIGINLTDLGIYVDAINKSQFSIGIYCDNQEWVVYNVDERNVLFESYRGEENIAFERLYKKVFVRLDEFNFVNDSVSKDIIQTTQSEVFSFLQAKHEMEEWELKDTWEYLTQNFRVLNELKYYVVHQSFVPIKDAYIVEGYSAEEIFNQTYLNEIGALSYLIYLKRNPKQALEDFKAGLPKKSKNTDLKGRQ